MCLPARTATEIASDCALPAAPKKETLRVPLLQTSRPDLAPSASHPQGTFPEKKQPERWVVFDNTGTSVGGLDFCFCS